MSTPLVLMDRPAPHVVRLLINRPDKRNAIDQGVREALTAQLQALHGDASVRALVFGGAAGTLSAGGDLPTMVGLSEPAARARMRNGHVMCRLLADLPIPVVCAMEGFAAGAAVGLALLGDHIVAGEGTKVLFPFLRIGLAPDWAIPLTLPRRVGLGTARRVLTAGVPVAGAEAMRIGLADQLVADAQVMPVAIETASRMARLPREAYARMKHRLNHPSTSLEEELLREEADQAGCITGDDFREGYDAFTGKREPDFILRPGLQR